jgi:hypothetical protein
MSTHYVISGLLGATPDRTTTGTTTDGQNAQFKLGTVAKGTDGTEWMYVQAGSIISQYMWVAVDANGQAALLNVTNAGRGHRVGVAQVAFADNDFGWVALSGQGTVKGLVRSSCASAVALYTDVSASGFLDDSATATQALIEGVVIITTQGSTTAQEGSGASLIVSYPRNR